MFDTRLFIIFIISFCLTGIDRSAIAADISKKQVAGYVEKVLLYPGGLSLRAKLDTGAKNSSLNAQDIGRFRQDDTDWVRFTLTNSKGKSLVIELPVIRISTVRRHFERVQERPVIKLSICLGGVLKEAEVNLVDRTGLNYQMLIGRTYLNGDFLIDPETTFQLKPSCKPACSKPG
jgi:hypothetical protein